MFMKRLSEERGSIWVIGAFFIPVVIIFGLFAVDAGNFFTHKRHLQTQADAAALAGATQFALPCTSNPADPYNTATTSGKVNSTARDYAGPSATFPTAPYNKQVGTTLSSNIHALLNAVDFWGQGNDAEFGSPLWGAQPCDQGYIDVKMTEKTLKYFFGMGNLPTINAEARARFTQAIGEKGFLPLGLPLPNVAQVTATIRACDTANDNSGTKLATVPLVKASVQDMAGFTKWVPAAGNFALAKPGSFNQCVGDYMSLDTNVEVSGNPDVAFTPGLANCNTKFIDCYQTSEGRVWKPGNTPSPTAEQNPPAFRDVNLGPACAPGTTYWSSAATANLPCASPLSAGVDWGTLATLAGHSGFHEMLVANGGGGTSATAQDACKASGICAFPSGITSGDGTAGSQPNGAAAMQAVTIDWEYWWDSGPNGYKCKPAKHCSGTSPTLARGNSDDQSPVARVILTNQDPTTNAYYGLPIDSTPYDSYPVTATIAVYTQGDPTTGYFVTGQRAVLRAGISQGNQSLVCDPDYTQGKTVPMFVNGCKPLYGINNLDGTVGGTPPLPPPGPNPLTWEPCPSKGTFFFYPQAGNTSSWYCIPTEPGLRPPQVADGIAIRTGNCGNPQTNACTGQPVCNNRNNWVAGKSYDPNLKPGDPGYEPRVIKIFLIPVGALNNSNGNDVVEVVGFAGFYVTGWNANGANSDPCQGLRGSNGQLEDVPTGNGGIAGRFVKIVDPPNAVPNPNSQCDPSNIIPCTTVLVR